MSLRSELFSSRKILYKTDLVKATQSFVRTSNLMLSVLEVASRIKLLNK